MHPKGRCYAIGVIELILDKGRVFTRTTEPARIALHTDAQNDVFGVDDLAVA